MYERIHFMIVTANKSSEPDNTTLKELDRIRLISKPKTQHTNYIDNYKKHIATKKLQKA